MAIDRTSTNQSFADFDLSKSEADRFKLAGTDLQFNAGNEFLTFLDQGAGDRDNQLSNRLESFGLAEGSNQQDRNLLLSPFASLDSGNAGSNSSDGPGLAELEQALAASGRGKGAVSSTPREGASDDVVAFSFDGAMKQLYKDYPEAFGSDDISNYSETEGKLYKEWSWQVGDYKYTVRDELDPFDLSNVTRTYAADTYKTTTSKTPVSGAGNPTGGSQPPSVPPEQPQGAAPTPAPTPQPQGGNPPAPTPAPQPEGGNAPAPSPQPQGGNAPVPTPTPEPDGDDDDDDKDGTNAPPADSAGGTKMPNPVGDPEPGGGSFQPMLNGGGRPGTGTVTPVPVEIDLPSGVNFPPLLNNGGRAGPGTVRPTDFVDISTVNADPRFVVRSSGANPVNTTPVDDIIGIGTGGAVGGGLSPTGPDPRAATSLAISLDDANLADGLFAEFDRL